MFHTFATYPGELTVSLIELFFAFTSSLKLVFFRLCLSWSNQRLNTTPLCLKDKCVHSTSTAINHFYFSFPGRSNPTSPGIREGEPTLLVGRNFKAPQNLPAPTLRSCLWLRATCKCVYSFDRLASEFACPGVDVYMPVCAYVCMRAVYSTVKEQCALTERLKVEEPEEPAGVGKNSPEAD